MKTLLAVAIPTAGILAALGALKSGLGAALLMLGIAFVAWIVFVIRRSR